MIDNTTDTADWTALNSQSLWGEIWYSDGVTLKEDDAYPLGTLLAHLLLVASFSQIFSKYSDIKNINIDKF